MILNIFLGFLLWLIGGVIIGIFLGVFLLPIIFGLSMLYPKILCLLKGED